MALDIKPPPEFGSGWLEMLCGVDVVLIGPVAVLKISDDEEDGSGILLLCVFGITFVLLPALLLLLLLLVGGV